MTYLNWSNERKNNNEKFHRAVVNLVCRDQYDFHSVWGFQSCLLKLRPRTPDTTWEAARYWETKGLGLYYTMSLALKIKAVWPWRSHLALEASLFSSVKWGQLWGLTEIVQVTCLFQRLLNLRKSVNVNSLSFFIPYLHSFNKLYLNEHHYANNWALCCAKYKDDGTCY